MLIKLNGHTIFLKKNIHIDLLILDGINNAQLKVHLIDNTYDEKVCVKSLLI